MKKLLQTLANLLIWGYYSFNIFFGILWYGKLPKISFYHLWRGFYNTYEEIFEDVNCQVWYTKDEPTRVKHRIIEGYIEKLRENETFKNNINSISIPIFNGKEIIGKSSIYPIMHEIKSEII